MTPMPGVLTVSINNEVFDQILNLEVTRDLQNIAGTFRITLVDEARLRNALIARIGAGGVNGPVNPGDPVTIAIDGEPVLVGWIDRPRFNWKAGRIACTIVGRDKTGDLVDCAALPNGPGQFSGVDLLQVATLVCAPFGIPVRADVDIGAPFQRLAKYKHMTALAFLESAARQRSVLLTSDGIGGLVLTRGGSTRGPAALAIGENALEIDAEWDWEQRFSDYYVMQDLGYGRIGQPAMNTTTPPAADDGYEDTIPGSDSVLAEANTGQVGHVADPEITRYRPTVRLTRSQSGVSSVQEQADWALRVGKGLADRVYIDVLEWRAGPGNILWRPNQVVPVWDPYSGIDRDMLIAGVTFRLTEEGRMTRLRVAGVTAYDRINESDRRRRGKTVSGKVLDSTVTPLSAS